MSMSRQSWSKDQRFNVSRWALEHPALTRYLMIVLMVLGAAAYFNLGQDEDPPFAFRVMVVRAYWPGATAQEVAEQVTDKIERTLQEVPYADKIQSYTKPGESFTLMMVKDYSPPKEIPNLWYQVRKKVGDMRHTLPQGVIGPFFNDELATYTAPSTPCLPMVFRRRSCASLPSASAPRCCACPMSPRLSCSACSPKSSSSRFRSVAWLSWVSTWGRY